MMALLSLVAAACNDLEREVEYWQGGAWLAIEGSQEELEFIRRGLEGNWPEESALSHRALQSVPGGIGTWGLAIVRFSQIITSVEVIES